MSKEVASLSPRRMAANDKKSRRHLVRRGETLYDVSKKYGVTLNQLANANKVKVNYRVLAGERLTIPD
jgi:LysM repeat protein